MPIELFKAYRSAFEEYYTPILDALNGNGEFYEINFPREFEIRAAIEFLNIDPQHLYVVDNPENPFNYCHKHVLYSFPTLQVKYLKQLNVDEKIRFCICEMKTCIETRDFERAFLIMDKRILFDSYQELFDVIPDNLKFDLFIKIYTRSEYRFSEIRPDAIKEISGYRLYSSREQSTRDGIKTVPQEDGFITIYRGVGDLSTPLNEAYSWTTDIKVASFFANRFGFKGTLYRARVHISKVIVYLDDKKEKEVLVLPNDVMDIQQLQEYSIPMD